MTDTNTAAPDGPRLSPSQRETLATLSAEDWTSTRQVVERSGHPPGRVLAALDLLRARGLVELQTGDHYVRDGRGRLTPHYAQHCRWRLAGQNTEQQGDYGAVSSAPEGL